MGTACIWEPRSGRGLWDARFKPGWLGCTGMFMLIRPYRPYRRWAEQRSLGSMRLEIPVPYGETDCWQDIFNMTGAQRIAEQGISMPAAPADPGGIVPTVGGMFRRYADMVRMDHLACEDIFRFMLRFSVFSWCMYRHSGNGRRFILSLENLLEGSPVCSLFFNAVYWGWTGGAMTMPYADKELFLAGDKKKHCDADTAAAISKNVYRTLSAVFEGGMLSDTCACDSAYRLVLVFFLCCQMNSYIHCAYCEQGGSICSAVREQWVGCGRFHFCSVDMLYPPSPYNTELTRQERMWPFGKDTQLYCGISIADMLQSFDIPDMPAEFSSSLVLTDILCALLAEETDKIRR